MCPTSKRSYRTRRKAIVALDQLRTRRDKGYGRSERRVYRCPHCGEWHLTSQAG